MTHQCECEVEMKILSYKIAVIISLFLFSLGGHHSTAQTTTDTSVPEVIAFDGFLMDAEGSIIPDGEYLIVFSLYDQPDGGEPLWTEVQNKVKVINGGFSTYLGDERGSENFSSLFDKQLYIGIKLGYDEELNPRVKLLPVPFSMRAKIAIQVPDNSVNTNKIAPLAVTDEKIKSVDWTKIENKPDFNLPPVNKQVAQNQTAELPYYWRRHGNYLVTGDEFLGTINDRNLVIKTDSVTRMIFEPYGKIWMGTAQDSVLFEMIGKSTLVDVYVKGKLGVGSDFDHTYTKLQVTATGNRTPFRIDHNNSNIFNIDPEGRVVITSTLTGEDDETDNYPLFIDAVDQGIAIQLDGNTDGDNNFISFWDDDGATGSIEGQTLAEHFSDAVSIAHDVWFAAQIVALAVAMSVEPLEVPDVIKLVDEIAYFEFEIAWAIFTVGITYESGGADYAEWLEKKNISEIFSPGDIVGVYGGKISKQTQGAEQVMSISLSPFVLGNMPPEGDEYKFEKVAFKGQVPVKVLGKVIAGDYIIPSGLEDGIGIAVRPELMTGEEFGKTIGRAWESSNNPDVKFINVGIGLPLKDVAGFITRRISENEQLRKELISDDEQLNYINAKISEMKENLSVIKNALNIEKTKSSNRQKVTLK